MIFPFGVSTQAAYGWLDGEPSEQAREAGSVRVESLATWDGVARVAHNDFEHVVVGRHPSIASALASLRSHPATPGDDAAIAMLAGSGATVFLASAELPRDMRDPHASALRLLHTRTATRVVAVEVSD